MRIVLLFMFGLLPASQAFAQQPQSREMLQRQIVERLIQNYQAQAGLTEEQSRQFRQVFGESFRERRMLEAEQRRLIRALEDQLRPGIAANIDSVVVLLDAIAANRQARVDQATRSQAQFATFLSPVQQAQLVLEMERFQRQIENILRRRAGPPRPDGTTSFQRR